MLTKQLDKLVLLTLLALLTLLFYYTLGTQLITEWMLNANGTSKLTGKFPEWDFTNLWMGGHLALMGHPETVFIIDDYHHFLDAYFHTTLPHHEWSYPPHLLLVGAVFALLPLLPAYLLWTFGSWGLVAWFVLRQRLPTALTFAALASPAIFINILIGQNGALTAFLFLGGLTLAPRRPLLGGLLLGLLSFKPHLCLLVPVIMLATRNWRALAMAAATAMAMILLTTLWLGADVWNLWHSNTVPFMVTLMEAQHPHPWMLKSVTVFYSLRDFGLSVPLAYVLQWLATMLCAAATWMLWRRKDVPLLQQVALSALLAILATPYAFSYDLVACCIAAVLLFHCHPRPQRASLYCLWMLPFFANYLNYGGLAISPLFLIAALLLHYPWPIGFRPKMSNE